MDEGRYDNLHGDEDEILAEEQELERQYWAQHEDDWRELDEACQC